MAKKKKKEWRRPGYEVVAFRARTALVEALDNEVEARRQRALQASVGEPLKATRTTVILDALAQYLRLMGDPRAEAAE